MCGFFSFMPPYWRVHDTVAARAMLRIRRACYLCDEIHGQPGMFESESLYHMLIEWRSDLKKAGVDLSELETTVAQSEDPPAFNDSEMWAVMLLCMSTESLPQCNKDRCPV